MFIQFLSVICVLRTIDSLVATQVNDGMFTMSGDEGDFITRGKTYTYRTAAGDVINVIADTSLRGVRVAIDGYHGDNWSLDLQAPVGKRLVVGEYWNATRYPFNSVGSGISINGNGRGCNTLTGSFVIKNYSPGPNGEVDRFQATFEQHCEGGSSAARGSVSIGNHRCAWTICGEACESQLAGHLYMCDFRQCGLKKQFYCCQSKHC